jgi:predicted RNA-binding Zn ribbon-like protein
MSDDPQVAGRAPEAGMAPGRLEIVRAFVNTLDIETGTDQLDTPDGLARWLAGSGLAAGGSATLAELRYAVELREALRSVLRAHVSGHGDLSRAVGDLRVIAAGLPARFEIGPQGQVFTVTAAAGVAAGLAGLLLIAAEATTTGTWNRLKVCGADDCQWGFYDRSPTRSGHWCSMAVCGSRAKSRAYRRRAGITPRG